MEVEKSVTLSMCSDLVNKVIIALRLSWDIPLLYKRTGGMSHNSFEAVMEHPIVVQKDWWDVP